MYIHTQLHQVPRLRVGGAICPLPLSAFHDMCTDNFLFVHCPHLARRVFVYGACGKDPTASEDWNAPLQEI